MRFAQSMMWGILLSLLAAETAVPAPTASRFRAHPEERAALAEQIRERQHTEKTNAVAWAQSRGIPVREEREGRVRELMKVSDGKPIYFTTYNKNAAISTAANLVRDDASFGVDGSGVVVGVWDGGAVLTNHVELVGRVRVVDDANELDNHATHVAGTIGAAGVNSNAKGMAPAVSIKSYEWNNDIVELTLAGADGPGQSDAVYLSNHSYGYEIADSSDYYLFGLYNDEARDMDQALHAMEYCLPFIAAGNERTSSPDGYDTITMFGVAKNTITVGGVNDAVSYGSRSLAGTGLYSYGSFGPADDGRIKPDIVANGVQLYSCGSAGPTSYYYSSGTSMASPNACGSAALLLEFYRNQTSGGAMRASTLKGLIIHTADDLGRPGPDYQYGWGLMNTLEAAAMIRDVTEAHPERMIDAELTTGSMSQSYTVSSSGLAALRVTLCWTDQPGLSNGAIDDERNPDLVNDLDLKIIGPDGQTHYPYSLSYASPSANAVTTGENSRDNVEQVIIDLPVPGDYTIIVDCDEALRYYSGRPRPSLKTGVTQQRYSLLISGGTGDADGDSLPDDWELAFFGSETNAVAAADADGDGADNLSEYVAGTDPTDSADFFSVSEGSSASDAGFALSWEPLYGRLYQVNWTTNLTLPFVPISEALTYPVGTYTDSVHRAGTEHFYRIGVKLNP